MKKHGLLLTIMGIGVALLTIPVLADNDAENLKKLGSSQRTDTGPMGRVPQGGKYADNLSKVLQAIKLPEDFKIELFALVPEARNMAVSRNKTTAWIGTRKNKVWSVTDRDMDNVADTVEEFSPSVKFDIPNGICYTPDGFLYVVVRNRVLLFPAAEYLMGGSDTAAFLRLPNPINPISPMPQERCVFKFDELSGPMLEHQN